MGFAGSLLHSLRSVAAWITFCAKSMACCMITAWPSSPVGSRRSMMAAGAGLAFGLGM
jgi:hypothetical protein